MNIYVDATPILRKPDGVGRYSVSILRELIKLDKTNSYRALAFADDRARTHTMSRTEIKYEYLPWPRQVYNQWFKRIGQVSVNRWLKRQPHVVLYPNFVNFPRIKNTKTVLVIHDLAFLETPETLAKRSFGKLEKVVPKSLVRANLFYLKKFVPRAIKQVDAVVAVSEETQEALAREYGLNASNITLVPNAVDEVFFKRRAQAETQSVKVKYGLPDEYILFLGTIEPRKNVLNLMEAYISLPAALRERFPLVLAGRPGWNNKAIYARMHELMEAGHSILPIGFVDDDDLPALYQQASLFVFPSIHEGFGLPILEAFASKVPVVTSDLPPMNRLAKSAAEFFDPDQVSSIAKAINKVLSSRAAAKSMSAKGLAIAQRHRWANSAQALLDLITALTKTDA